MMTPGEIENKVEQALASIDNVQRASANPFLFTRIEQSLKQKKEKGWVSYLSRPAFAIAAVLIVLLMNSVVFFRNNETRVTPATQVLQDDEQLFAREYSFGVSTADRFYSLNEEQP